MLVSVFDRFDGKTPSRGVCDAIARAFTRSPVRDPTRRALARERPDDALAIKTRAAAPVAATPTFPKTPRVLLPGADIGDCPPHADPVDAGALSLARSPFRGAAWRDAAGARATFETHSRGAFEDGGAALGGRFQVCSGTEITARADSAEASRASDEPEVGLAFFAPATNASEDVWADAVADAPEALAAAAASEGGDEDETRDGETLTRAQSAILSLPPAGAELEGGSSLDALVGNASRLARLERALDVAAWQTVGTSLYVGERAETATPPRARRASSPSPSPPPPDPAPGEPFLPETRGVLASETNGVTAAEPPVAGAGASLFPRPDDAGEASDADAASRDRDREGDEAPETSIRGAPVSSRRVVVVDFPEGEPSRFAGIAAPSPAYAPGVSLEALVREKDDDLAAALALGARTGRWVPLAAAGGEAQARTGNGSKNDDAAAGTDAPSSSAQAAMVVSAAEELGDGEEHPVTWKQIKTWFENRRMTQKRIKEGNARPPRRAAGADADADAAKNANARGKPPRPPALKNRAAPDAGGSKDAFHSDPPPARRSLDETRRDATARPGAKRARTDASGAPAALRLPARRSLDLDRSTLDAAAAAAAAAEDLRARDAGWGKPPSALTREMSWADIHDALAGAERARAP